MSGCIVGAGAVDAPPFKGGSGRRDGCLLELGRGEAAFASGFGAVRRLGR